MKKRATLVDYGLGNLHSVENALRVIGVEVITAENGNLLAEASHVIVPGVGAFADGMEGLRQRGHDQALHWFVESGQGHLLGICLGAQLLLGESEEFGHTAGLGIIPGKVAPVPANGQKVPHVGWKQVRLTPHGQEQTITANGTWAYFVHSYHAIPDDPAHTLASAAFGHESVTAMVGNGKVIGCQFHPEKSGMAGLQMLKSFMKL